MRNSSILVTAAIAVVAGGLALALSQSDQVKALIGKTDAVEQEAVVATDTPVAETATPEEATTVAATDATTATGTEVAMDAAQQTESNMTPVDLDGQAPAAGDETAAASAADEEKPAGTVKIDVKAALEDRSIGSKDAKVVVEEFSSLTCPHCAFFHNEIFPQVKKNYIDTGKVRWVFRGFPLNQPALQAEMVARCAPKDQYVKLIDMMFREQAKWAFTQDPMATLSIMVRIGGINDDLFTSCINNTELQTGMAKKIEDATKKYDIGSTPTFVLNEGEKTFSGAGSYTGFAYDLDQLLNQDPATKPVRATNENKEDFLPPAGGSSTSSKLDPNAKTE